MGDVMIIPAVLGWSNPTDAAESHRLYATDKGRSPRFDGVHGRVVEQALRESTLAYEGDRFLVVHLGDRFVTDDQVADATTIITAALSEDNFDSRIAELVGLLDYHTGKGHPGPLDPTLRDIVARFRALLDEDTPP